MATSDTTAVGLGRTRRKLITVWSTAWVLGVGGLAGLAIHLSRELHLQGFDAELAYQAAAIYGMAWFDEAGELQGTGDLLVEGELEDSFQNWILEPGPPLRLTFGTSEAAELTFLQEMAQDIVEEEEERVLQGPDSRRRVYGTPTYRMGSRRPVAAILVAGDPSEILAEHVAFTRVLLAAAASLGALGLGVSWLLARLSLRPVERALDQRERFVVAAAHELRTPVAALRAVADSARAGDEDPHDALARISRLSQRNSEVVEDLLLYARLDAGQRELEREPVRLDLLVEAACPEAVDIRCELEESVVSLDPGLARVALRNLVVNALQFAGDHGVRIQVKGSTVVVADDGPGFPLEVVERIQEGVASVPSRAGAGIGLATVRMIAELHGGRLVLENIPGGGAKAQLLWGSSS